MQRPKSGLVVLVLLLLAGVSARPAGAQTNAGVLFLRIAAGARAAGMGEAFVAIANDATATHWNPAGLGTSPLNSEWTEHPIKVEGTVLDAVALKNGLPYTDNSAYDIWIVTDHGLAVYRPGGDLAESRSVKLETADVGSMAAAVRRYAPFLSEDDADVIARSSAAAHMSVPPAQIDSLLARVTAAIPEGYRDRTTLDNIIRDFRGAYYDSRLQEDRLPEWRAAVAALPDSGAVDPALLDRVRFAMEHCVTQILPRLVRVNLNDLVRPPLRAIASDGDNLYVGAQNGLLTYDGNRWNLIPPPEGADWTRAPINCLETTGGHRLWVGTDDGILVRASGQWQKLGRAEGLPSRRVLRLALSGSKSGWALTDGGLAYYDGAAFTASVKVAANVGDSLPSLLGRFLGTDDDIFIAKAAERVVVADSLDAGFTPKPGDPIAIPYQLGLRGDVTAMELDSYDRLWVGTTLGTFRYSKGHWTSFGYEPVQITEATTAEAVARTRLGRRATAERAQKLAEYIAAYNGLADGQIPAGRKIYVYRNPAGSRVLDLAAHSDQLYVATEVGQLEVSAGNWSRYYHGNLDQDQVRALVVESGDVWFVTNERVVVYQRPVREISFMHAKWLPQFNLDLYYEYLTYVTNVEGVGTLGASVTFLSYGEIQRTDELGNIGPSFFPFDGAFTVSYGTRLNPNLTAGISAKVIYSRLANQGAGKEIGSGSATAFAMDAGFLYRTPWRRLTLGGALTNVGPNISYIDAQQSDPLPRNLALGLAYRLWDTPYNKFTIIGELNKELVDLTGKSSSELKQIVYNAGAEYWYGSSIAVRGGYIYDQDGQIKTPTLGFGLSYQRFQMDFAYIPSSKDLPLANTLRVGLTGKF